jgi:hypothetical protein
MSTVYTYYVATNGNDSNDGSIGSPFLTLTKARDTIRTVRGVDFGGANVYVRAGDYLVDNFALSLADATTVGSPIIYKAYNNEAVRLMGGTAITGFSLVDGSDVNYSRLNVGARSSIYKATLNPATYSFGTIGFIYSAFTLTYNGVPMELARWPNANEPTYTGVQSYATGGVIGWDRVSGIIGGNTGYNDSTYYTGINGIKYATNVPLSHSWTIPSATSLNPIWINTYSTQEYYSYYIKITGIDTATQSLYYAGDTELPYKQSRIWGNSGNYQTIGRFYYVNVLEELNIPGEYYLDRINNILYFYPPGPITATNTVGSVTTGQLLNLSAVSGTTFNGFELAQCRQDSVLLSNSNYNNIINCNIHDGGLSAINILNSTGNVVSGCNIHHFMGIYGVNVEAGDYPSLTPGNNLIVNNTIHDTSLWRKGQSRAIMLKGVGNTAKNNLIYNTPYIGIWFFGNDHLIEDNEIHHTCTETCDGGAIYGNTAFDISGHYYQYTTRGTVVKNNYVHDSIKDPNTFYEGQAGIYVDDICCGVTITGNIVHNVANGVQCNGGRDNIVRNNIITKSRSAGIYMAQCAFGIFSGNYPSGHGQWQVDPNGASQTYNNSDFLDFANLMNYKNPPYSKYPHLTGFWDDWPQHAMYCDVLTNVVSGTANTNNDIVLVHKLSGFPDEGGWYNSSTYSPLCATTIAIQHNLKSSINPKFTSTALTGLPNFELVADSPAFASGFVRIPIENIGYFAYTEPIIPVVVMYPGDFITGMIPSKPFLNGVITVDGGSIIDSRGGYVIPIDKMISIIHSTDFTKPRYRIN